MRKHLIFASICCFTIIAGAQIQKPLVDSPSNANANETNQVKKFFKIEKLTFLNLTNGTMDTIPYLIDEQLRIARELGNDSLSLLCLLDYASYLDYRNDSKQEIEYELRALRIAELKFANLLPFIYQGLGSAYADLGNTDESLKYLKIGYQNLLRIKEKSNLNFTTYNFQFANTFFKAKKYDSALHYAQIANEFLFKISNAEMSKLIRGIIANIYDALKQPTLAESYYKSSIFEVPGNTSVDAMINADYSNFLLKWGRLNEAKLFGLKAYEAARLSQGKVPYLASATCLQKIYERLHQNDSAYYFAKRELALRDSLFSQDRLYAVQEITFHENLLQKEEEEKSIFVQIQHKQNIQYAAIAIGLVCFILLFLIFSHSVVVNKRMISFFGVIGLLLVFEFINLWIHPYIEAFTGKSPLFMLLIMVTIATVLVPAHHKLESWINQKLVEKNKKIRLAAAHRTITDLEKEQKL